MGRQRMPLVQRSRRDSSFPQVCGQPNKDCPCSPQNCVELPVRRSAASGVIARRPGRFRIELDAQARPRTIRSSVLGGDHAASKLRPHVTAVERLLTPRRTVAESLRTNEAGSHWGHHPVEHLSTDGRVTATRFGAPCPPLHYSMWEEGRIRDVRP